MLSDRSVDSYRLQRTLKRCVFFSFKSKVLRGRRVINPCLGCRGVQQKNIVICDRLGPERMCAMARVVDILRRRPRR